MSVFNGKIIDGINGIDNFDDLNIVINVIKAKQKSLRASANATAKSNFAVGTKVKVDSRGSIMKGVITKVNRTRAIVDIDGSKWNVPFSIMTVVI